MIKKYANKLIVSRLRRRVEKLLSSQKLLIITITGTVGKTTAKLAIGQVLSDLGRNVCYSADSYNTEIGVPLAIFGLKAPDRLSSPAAWRKILNQIDAQIDDYKFDTVVIEIAEDERAMMTPWLKLLNPQISVLTGISPAHMARFKSLDDLRDDTVWLACQAKKVYYNADFDLVREALERKKGAHGFGLDHGEINFKSVARTSSGTLKGELVIGKASQLVNTQMIAPHSIEALLAAASVAHDLNYSTEKIAKSLSLVTAVNGRMRLLAGVSGIRLIDDTYNASPKAVMAALDTLMDLPAKSHIAVLGSMNELGEFSAGLHEQVAQYAAAKKVDLLVTVGKEAANYLAPAAVEAGLLKSSVKQFRTPYEAGHYLKKVLQEGDLVLVKGSQNAVFTEETTRILLSPDLHPANELVRQSRSWKKIKKKSFGL